MNVFEMVVIIVALSIFGKIAINALRAKPTRPDKEAEQQSAERMAKLEERVKVLERIVTSDRYDLNQQFKNLDD